MPVLFGRVNRATVRGVAHLGYEARPLRGVTCCGSLHAHNGDLEGARRLARAMLRASRNEQQREGVPAPIVVNSAGCSAHMKELAQLFDADDPDRAAAEVLAARLRLRRVRRAAHAQAPPERSIEGAWKGPFAWDDPCHLCHAQGIRTQPREVLGEIPGANWKALQDSESCCGSAGIYSILRPKDSAAVLAPKLDALERSGARTLVTANPGCQLQWENGIAERGLDVEVVHLAELVARAYEGRTVE
ncbi:MAG: (Fe-S)-binding protein [Planctomycetota bacterium]